MLSEIIESCAMKFEDCCYGKKLDVDIFTETCQSRTGTTGEVAYDD